MKKAAVVILNWNGQKLLEQFLPSLVKYSPDASIYVADNSSDDLSVELLRVHFPMVTVIRNVANFGFAKGYNEALRFVEEEIYVLINSDVEVTQGWLDPVLALFELEPNTAIVQPKILSYKDRGTFEYAGAGGGYIDRFGYPFCRGRIFDSLEPDNGQYDDTADIFWASGACLFIRKEVFRELRGFDADFFAHMEEIDLCWRAAHLNLRTRYCGASTVYHVGGATLDAANPHKTYLNFRNSLFMLVKNVPQGDLLPILLMRLVLDGIAGARFLVTSGPAHTGAVIRAHFAFYKRMFIFFERRPLRITKKYFAVRSIAWQYFVKKRRHFGNLLTIV